MRALVPEFQPQLSRSGGHDGRAGHRPGSHDDLALGTALHPGIREAVYLYRAVDKQGFTVDFYLSRKRDVEAAKQFLRKAMKNQRVPTKITLDAYAASHWAVAELKKDGELPKRVRARTSKYLNNGIEQDHRRVKHRIRAMVGLKSFCAAGVTISGIELTEKIRKGQFKIGKLGGSKATMPEIWRTALAASLAIITNSQSEPHRPSVEARIAPEPELAGKLRHSTK